MTTEWNDKKEKKVLRRYRFLLTLRIIRVALIVLFIFWAYSLVVMISYDQSTKGEKLIAYSQLAVDWMSPGVTSEFGGHQWTEISPLLTQKTSISISREIGKEEKVVGQLDVKKPLLTSWANISYDFYQKSDQPRFNFWLPIHPETGKSLDGNEDTVADLAFSTNQYFTPEEMFLLLEDYDLEVIWMPVYMGELDLFTEGWWGGENSVSVGAWGLTHGTKYDSDYRANSRDLSARENIEMNKKLMISNMNRIYHDDPNLVEAIFGIYFEERIQFLEENGFMVYGAVVTGPTKELLRLQELKEIQGVQLGEITFWNW